ncbi:MAG: hypothetical protein JO067_06520 [Cupriavidus sp.]|nr:hypothetical protein [Cupriavidus sp.]
MKPLVRMKHLAYLAGTPLTSTEMRGRKCITKPQTLNQLRTGILDTCMGPGIAWKFKSVAGMDDAIEQLVAVKRGEYGLRFECWQHAIRTGLDAYKELQRLQGLKRRSEAKEAQQVAIMEQAVKDAKFYETFHQTGEDK